MIHENYPVLRTNPARDLYKYWYQLVEYNAPHLLTPKSENDGVYGEPAAFVFQSGHSLSVDRNPENFVNGKPMLYIQGVFRIWPNGHFTPVSSCYGWRWALAELKLLEKLTFLRWGYVARDKAIWVQDTPRRGYTYYSWGAVDREHPNEKDFERRVPYLPLDGNPLFSDRIKYRLKKVANDKWIIAVAGLGDVYKHTGTNGELHRKLINEAEHELSLRYARAQRRYDWWARRAELAAIREGKVEKPRKAIPALDRVNLTRMIIQGMTVYEPKVGPGGRPLAKQLALPLDGKEVVGVGR